MSEAQQMNQDIKHQWCEALRSGAFSQGRNALMYVGDHGTEYCPLGVLQVVYHNNHSRGIATKDNQRLPLEIMQWASLPDRDPWVSAGPSQPKHRISHWNDVSLASFGTIAKMIEVSL